MIEILKEILFAIPVYFPQLIILLIVWALVGWFYVHVLGKEFHDFIVFSILVAILAFIFLLLTNGNLQVLLFGV